MLMKHFILTITLFGLISLQSCTKVYTIEDLYNLPGCTGPCGVRMECEGMEVTLKAKLNDRNMLKLGRKYFLRAEDADRTISVEFAESIPDDIVHKLDEAKEEGKTIQIKGVIEGFDLATKDYCQRAQILFVQSPEDISIL